MKRNYEIKGMSCGGYVSNVKRGNEEKKSGWEIIKAQLPRCINKLFELK